MLGFKRFLVEEEQHQAKHIKHLVHVEDRPLQKGEQGLKHALESLTAAHEHVKAGLHSSQLTTKYDGSPAIVYGHHPGNGKFFVSSKSIFNKSPKINYTDQDIERHHGHAPGLVDKLKTALKLLPKVAPPKGVYQGDIMFTGDDLQQDNKTGFVSFHPNPSGLTYTAHGREAERARKAKLGLVTHLIYHGDDPARLQSHHGVDHQNFKLNSDVYTIDPRNDTSKVIYDPKDQETFEKHIKQAEEASKKGGEEMFKMTKPHQGEYGDLEAYINYTVKTGEKPSYEGFMKHLENRSLSQIEELKTAKGKKTRQEALAKNLLHIEDNKQHYNRLFGIHKHLQDAKNILVKTLNKHTDFEHHHNGQEAAPEGYVFHSNGESDKFVARHEFSRRNLLRIR